MREAFLPPNLLTWSRILLTPAIAWMITTHQCGSALGLMFASGVTDALDGFLARRFNWRSRLGAYVDPAADKLLLVSVYLALGASTIAPAWLVALVIGRDVLILVMVAAAVAFTRYREFPPSIAGKISTIIQMGAAVGLLAICTSPELFGPFWTWLCIWATAAATVWSGLDYSARGLRLWKDRERISDAGGN